MIPVLPDMPATEPENDDGPPDPNMLRAKLDEIRRVKAKRARERLERIRLARRRKQAPAARERLSEFVKQAWQELHPTEPLEWNWHLDVICDHVQALAGYLMRARREHDLGRDWKMPARNCVINVPPRSLKTEIVGVFFPAWLWLKDPSLPLRYVSGNERVRTKASRMCRDLIGSDWYRHAFGIGWNIRPDADAIGLFVNTTGGEMYYSSYEQKITGEGTAVIIVDDPIDAAKAASEIERNAVNTKWDLAVENRVNDRKRCIRIGIMQRLHEEDWTAHVLSKGTWRHVCLPTEFEHRSQLAIDAINAANDNTEQDVKPPCLCKDCLAGESFLGPYDRRTEDGELLHPARLSGEELEEERAKGSLYYAGQHAQRPAPLDGAMFKRKWWGSFDLADAPKFRRVGIFVDCSSKKTATGSRTAIGLVGEGHDSRRYVCDVIAKPMDIIDIKTALVGERRAKGDKDAPIGGMLEKWPRATLIIEDKSAGSDVIVELKDVGINVVAWDPKNSSKESRAFSVVGIVESGDVLLARGAPWKDDFLHELSTFPNGKWDDQVDMISMALAYFRGERALVRTKW